jgi:hypothetical protein
VGRARRRSPATAAEQALAPPEEERPADLFDAESDGEGFG